MISINRALYDGVKFRIAVDAPVLGNQDDKVSDEEFEEAKDSKTVIPHTHEYICKDCGHEWDERVRHAPGVPDWPIPPCPKCKSKNVDQTA